MALLFCYKSEIQLIETMTDGVDRTERLKILKELAQESEATKKDLAQGKGGTSAFKTRLYELRDIRSRCAVLEERILDGWSPCGDAKPKGDKPQRKLAAAERFYLQQRKK